MSQESVTLPGLGHYEQLSVRYEEDQQTLWYTLRPIGRPNFNMDLLAELAHLHSLIVAANERAMNIGEEPPIRYTVLDSDVPGVFNLGGDLELFHQLIVDGDREGLLAYATACIDVLYPNAVNFCQPMTTITLVQGEALGGGFEAAISSNLVVAEESSRFGLPEILFNLVPGMGAYSFLIRRTSPAVTEHLITSGEILTARQMLDLKLVDEVVPDGMGPHAVRSLITRHSRRGNARRALGRIKQCFHPVTYEELMRITRIWVDTAMQLGPRDMRMIQSLVRAQDRRREEALRPRRMEAQG